MPPSCAHRGARRLTCYRFFHTLGRTLDGYATALKPTTSRAPSTIADDRSARSAIGPPRAWRGSRSIARPCSTRSTPSWPPRWPSTPRRAAADRDVRWSSCGGAGRAFCSGMDRTAHGRAAPSARRSTATGSARLNWLEDMPKVTLAVLHGYSIGGGLQLGPGLRPAPGHRRRRAGPGRLASRHHPRRRRAAAGAPRRPRPGQGAGAAQRGRQPGRGPGHRARELGVRARASVDATVARLSSGCATRRRPPTPTSSACSTSRSTAIRAR